MVKLLNDAPVIFAAAVLIAFFCGFSAGAVLMSIMTLKKTDALYEEFESRGQCTDRELHVVGRIGRR